MTTTFCCYNDEMENAAFLPQGNLWKNKINRLQTMNFISTYILDDINHVNIENESDN